MAIVNRDLEQSQQKDVYDYVSQTALATSSTFLIAMVPYPCEVVRVESAVTGISGTPLHNLGVVRFVAGAGLTTITGLNSSFALSTVGTSGVQGYSLIAAGSTLLQMQAGDQLVLVTAGANSAVATACVSVVVKKLQDIVSYYAV